MRIVYISTYRVFAPGVINVHMIAVIGDAPSVIDVHGIVVSVSNALISLQ
jgi:hypothetical protein